MYKRNHSVRDTTPVSPQRPQKLILAASPHPVVAEIGLELAMARERVEQLRDVVAILRMLTTLKLPE
jgi:hypothetical protein